MKNFKSSISTSMERAAIRVAPSGKAATKVFAALLVLELAAGTIGCSKSKPVAQNAQDSSNQTVATAPVAAIPSAPVAVNQPETAQKKSVKGPVRKLPRTLLYTDADSGFSLAYPRKSTLRTGQRAELQAIGMEWLPMNFVQQGGTTVTMLELPGTNGQEISGEFFSVSVHNGLTAEQCGNFAGESAANSDDKAGAAISRVSLHGFEYSELNRQTEQGSAKYYHRFVPGSGEISSCYEFTLAVKAPKKKMEGQEASLNSQVEKKDDFARLQRVLASVKIKADSEPVKVAATKDNAEVPSTISSNNEATDSAKTVAKSDASPR